MGIVGERLVGLIVRQVEERSLVVWYDPGADFKAVAERLAVPGTTVARYDGSFINLRPEIDSLLNGLEPPKLAVSVPVEQADTYHALVGLEAAGVVMQPGQQPFKCNTRLALVARNALKNVIGERQAGVCLGRSLQEVVDPPQVRPRLADPGRVPVHRVVGRVDEGQTERRPALDEARAASHAR